MTTVRNSDPPMWSLDANSVTLTLGEKPRWWHFRRRFQNWRCRRMLIGSSVTLRMPDGTDVTRMITEYRLH